MNNFLRLTLLITAVWLGGICFLWVDTQPTLASQERPVIKHGSVQVMVADVATAVAETLDLTTTFNGYILEQRQWDDDAQFHYASLTIGLPADNFEGLLQALKRLGLVQDEAINGQDVVDERVDLQSRLDNLYENQERLRSFLDVARNVTETLKVHQELVQIEHEIGDLQGRLNFLTDRADAATISLDILPFIPTATPTATATATPTPTATPLPTPSTWRPGDTAKVASVQLQDAAQDTADFFIYRVIVCGPWLVLLALVGFGIWRVTKLRKRQ